MFGLIDCNKFYASCERAFRPDLRGKPIVVLSNNDGCVIAMSEEAKAAGVVMGTPEYQARELLKDLGVAVFSSNYTLYADMSRRVMNLLAEECARIEVYSIDECFADMKGIAIEELEPLGWHLKHLIGQGVKIPVSVGIAPTKTLAKAANKMAKKAGGVMVITEENREAFLRMFPLGDVWGIGRQHLRRLEGMGCRTAWDFAQLKEGWVRKNLTVVGHRTLLELRGVACLELQEQRETKEVICTSRSFGEATQAYGPVTEAVATHAQRCAEKLRAQGSCATVLTVFLETNPHREELPQHYPSLSIALPVGSSSTPELVERALGIVKLIWKPGYRYRKAGVIVSGLVPASSLQLDIFDTVNRPARDKASLAMDALNRRYGQDMVRVAAQGYSKGWRLKAERRSPNFTTKWAEIPVVRG